MMLSRRSMIVASGACGLGTWFGGPQAASATTGSEDVASRNAAVLAGLADPGVALRTWRWIVVHHTAAEFATLPGIDRYHRTHFGDPLGAEYHFIINNGKKDRANLPIGLIEPARWRFQEPAWHLFKPDNAPQSIAICLVGNFEKRALPAEMLGPLTELTRGLMKLCGIPREQVSTHRVVDEKMTQCPGKLFPREAFLAALAE